MIRTASSPLDWIDPLHAAAGLAGREGILCLLSDGGPNGRYSWVAAEPDRVEIRSLGPGDPLAVLRDPKFSGQVVGLIAYDAGARVATGPRKTIWPDLMLARYPAMLVFDHAERTVRALGQGEDDAAASAARDVALAWLDPAADPGRPAPPAESLMAEADPADYRRAVAEVVARIAAGDLFQANIARAWSGTLNDGADPFDLFVRLARGPAPYGAFWRLGERCLVSNSPELFLTFDPADRRIETRPIKGTRPRDPDPVRDAAASAELIASEKDRAENLMIVDLMRNDLSRVCEPGGVAVDRLFALESFETVHHLVSTVSGTAWPGVGPAEILQATFPPGSITGAPKHQAMKEIARHEPPRGPWCGSLFLIDAEAKLTASVLIRTVGLWREDGRWRFRTQAGAGIVADSAPEAELVETEAKIAAVRTALIGQQSEQGIVSETRGRR